MSRNKWKKMKTSVGKWRMGDYLRQLSVVVVGIVITFTGSDLIASYSKEKEVKAVMQLIQSELRNNREQLLLVTKQLDVERNMGLMLLNRDFDHQSIPEDTLLAGKTVFSKISSFKYTQDALEVLKNSSLMQQVDDKDFLLSLIQVYEHLKNIEKDVAAYYSVKTDVLHTVLRQFNDEDRKEMIEGGIRSSYQVYLSSPEVRNYISIVPNYFDEGVFANADRLIKQVVSEINERYN